MREFPDIEVEVDIADRAVNLQEDGYDVAIRTGTLSDSSLIAKRLAPDRHVVVASPAYLARSGRPLRPDDLANHNCLVLGGGWQWSFSKNGAEASVRVNGSLRSNNGELLCHAALDGLGLIRISELEVLSDLRSGRLVQVLPDYEVSTNAAVWALYPSAKHVLPRLRVLLDFLSNWFREARGEEQRPVKPAPAAVATPPRSNGKSAAADAIRLRAG
jgi:DNA-binding transcriptional LysR family regulator